MVSAAPAAFVVVKAVIMVVRDVVAEVVRNTLVVVL
jgi:hypothetical protein